MKKIFSLLSLALFCMAANAQLNLADAIKSAQANAKVQVADGKEYYEVAPVTLTEGSTYVLDQAIDLGAQKLVIFGGEAKVIVKAGAQISTSTYLQIYGVNFDCSEATVAPIALSAAPDSAAFWSVAGDTTKFYRPSSNQNVFVNDKVIEINHCNFSQLSTPLFFANNQPWALKKLSIRNCIVQRNSKDDTALINLVACGAASIKNIVVANSTIYNTNVTNTSSYGLIRQQTANDPWKVWGYDVNGAKETASVKLYNNTFALYGKQFANNYPKNQIELSFKGNLFYNTPKLYQIDAQKRGGSLLTTADENIICEKAYSYDSNDAKFATVDSAAVDTSLVCTEALDFNNIDALNAYFANNSVSNVYAATCGDPRWAKVQFKTSVTKNVAGGAQEAVLTPDMLMRKTLAVGEKDAINTAEFPWAYYSNASSPLEVTTQGPWSSYNPYTGVACDPNVEYPHPWGAQKGFYYVTNTNGNYDVNKFKSIKVTTEKYLDVLVTNMTQVGFVLTGAGSNVNSAKVSVYNAKTNDLVDSKVSVDMAGKSQSASASGSKAANSSYLEMTGLDPDTYYDIRIEQNANDVAIHSILFWGTDNTIIPEEYHSPKAVGTGVYEAVSTADMLCKPVDGVNKYAIDPVNFAWVKFIDLGSDGNGNYITDGLYEATRGGAYSTVDIETGQKYDADFQGINIGSTTAGCQYVWSSYDLDVIANGGGWLDVHNYGAPKINADYKSMIFHVTGTAAVRFVLSGGSSKSENSCKISVVDMEGNVVAEKISDSMANKSNKLANTNTTTCTIDGLDVNAKYDILVKQNVNDTFIYAIHLSGDASVFANADAMGETDAISEVNAADNAVKTVKCISNGRIVIKSAKGTFSVAGAQIK